MRLTEEAVQQAISFTQNAKRGLEDNYNYMRNSTASLLTQWNDSNVERFMEVLDLFDSYVKNTAANMDEISNTLRSYLQFMHDYNS